MSVAPPSRDTGRGDPGAGAASPATPAGALDDATLDAVVAHVRRQAQALAASAAFVGSTSSEASELERQSAAFDVGRGRSTMPPIDVVRAYAAGVAGEIPAIPAWREAYDAVMRERDPEWETFTRLAERFRVDVTPMRSPRG